MTGRASWERTEFPDGRDARLCQALEVIRRARNDVIEEDRERERRKQKKKELEKRNGR